MMAPAPPGPDLNSYKWLQTERGRAGRRKETETETEREREREEQRHRVSDVSIHENHLERLKHLLAPHPLRGSDSVAGRWGVGMCVSQKLPGMFILLVQGPHFE